MANKNIKANNRINKQKEIEQKKRKKRKIIMFIFISILLIVALCVYLLINPMYKIKSIEVEGNNNISTENVIAFSEIKEGDNIVFNSKIVAEIKLKEHGYIEEAKVMKKFPNKIIIKITERKKAYQILTEEGKYILISDQGYILESSQEKSDLKTIIGMTVKDDNIKRLEEKDLDKLEKILHIEKETEKMEIANQIQKIDVKDEYSLYLNDDKLIIKLGNATNLSERMIYVKAIMKQENGNDGTIFVDGNLNEGFAPYFSAK